jgi:hypothetical protein
MASAGILRMKRHEDVLAARSTALIQVRSRSVQPSCPAAMIEKGAHEVTGSPSSSDWECDAVPRGDSRLEM